MSNSTEQFISYMIDQYGREVVDKAHEIVESFSKQIEENKLAGVIAADIFFQAMLEELDNLGDEE